MKSSWLLLLIGWLVGSFFGLGSIMGMLGGVRKPAAAPASA